MSSINTGRELWPLPEATPQVLEKVKQACEACQHKQEDIFLTCIRQHGASATEVSSVIRLVMPNLPDTASVTIEQLMEAISRHLMATA